MIKQPRKTAYKLFDFFANCEYFEEDFNYDEILKLPTPQGKDDGGGKGPKPKGAPYEHLGADIIASIQEETIGYEGMKIDRMFYEKFEDAIRENTTIIEAVEAGQWDRVIDYVNREVFDKPNEFYSLDKLRKAAAVDRRLGLREILEKIFGLIPRFKSKDELLEEEFSKFVADYKPEEAEAIPALKNYFKAYVTSDQIRHIIETDVPLELLTLESPLHYKGDLLTPDERKRLAGNIKGYDISPDMVRMSLVNLYLHGFNDPHIFEYDTLTSEERWDEYSDVIFANPPFMSPKGGIKPHKRFSIQAKRSEVLFVDYIAEHLTPAGRAGIIVPEGIIFQSQTAYKALRKMLVDNSLVAVISMPAGVFQPYSGVKTSILILDKSWAKQSDSIAFFKVENDGFGLGAQRRAIDKNDLPDVAKALKEYFYIDTQDGQYKSEKIDLSVLETLISQGTALIVPKEKIAANGDYNLSGERYREEAVSTTTYKLVPVGQFMKEGVKTIDPRKNPDEIFELWSIPAFDAGRPELLHGSEIGSQKKVVTPGDVLLSRIIPHIRRGWVVQDSAGRRQIASTEWIVFSSNEVMPGFLRQVLVSDFFHVSFMQTITGVGGSLSRANSAAVGEIQIPLPPLEVQKEIVAEIEGYQKVINGALAVLDNYRPHIPIAPDWPMEPLGKYFATKSGGTPLTTEPTYWTGTIPWVSPKDMKSDVIYDTIDHLSEAAIVNSSTKLVPAHSVICVVRSGILKHTFPVALTSKDMCINQDIIAFSPLTNVFTSKFLFYVLKTKSVSILADGIKPGVTVQSFYNGFFKDYAVPVPPLGTQHGIVADIEAEQALVAANRELISRFEKKIQATLARLWGMDGEDEGLSSS